MTTLNLDRELIRERFDLRRRGGVGGKVYVDDPYPTFHALREQGPVVEGIPHELLGFDGPAFFHGIPDPSRPHFSVFSYAECDAVYRNEDLYRSAPPEMAELGLGGLGASMLYMNGDEHRRYRALVQPSFVPAKAKWWMENWINQTVHALIDGFEADKHAELNIDFDAAIPMLTIAGSFGLVVEEAMRTPGRWVDGGGAWARRARHADHPAPAGRSRATTWSACWPTPRSPTRTARRTA